MTEKKQNLFVSLVRKAVGLKEEGSSCCSTTAATKESAETKSEKSSCCQG